MKLKKLIQQVEKKLYDFGNDWNGGEYWDDEWEAVFVKDCHEKSIELIELISEFKRKDDE